jgi:hypothetical protein
LTLISVGAHSNISFHFSNPSSSEISVGGTQEVGNFSVAPGARVELQAEVVCLSSSVCVCPHKLNQLSDFQENGSAMS